jgi:hypothetical protein
VVVHMGFVVGKVANFLPKTSVFILGASDVDKIEEPRDCIVPFLQEWGHYII